MTPNSYKVPRDKWRLMSELERHVFNDVYCAMAYNQKLFQHPKAKKIADEHWTTTAWNAAWYAADAVRDYHQEQKKAA